MIVYCTSRNTGPGFSGDPLHVLYVGTSIKDAEKAVGEFTRYQKEEKDFPKQWVQLYSAIPKAVVDWELIQFYMADGWWYSIVMFNLK